MEIVRVPTHLRDAFPWGKVAPKGPDEGRDALSILRVGAAACPDAPACNV